MYRFCLHGDARDPRAPLRSKSTSRPALVSGGGEGDVYRVRFPKTPVRSSPCHAHHKAQRGPNRGRRAHHCTISNGSLEPAVPERALRGVLTSARSYRHARQSLVARVRRTEDTGSSKSRLRPPAPSRGKACGVGTWEGGWDRLASAAWVRLPSVQSARLQRSSSAAPFAQPALDSPACTPRSCPFPELWLERGQLSQNGLRSGLANRKFSATAEPALGGRTACGLQS